MMYPNWFILCYAIILGYLAFIDWLYLSISIFDLYILIIFDLIVFVVLMNSHAFVDSKELIFRFIVLILFLIGFLFAIKKTKMGIGDLWVFCFAGLLLKPIDILEGFYFSVLIGGLYSFILVLLDKKNLKKKIPFIPFLSMGFLIAILFEIL